MILNLDGTSKNNFEIGEKSSTYSLKLAKSASMTANLVLTLPVNGGINGQVMQTNGSGVLSWVNNGGGVYAFGGIHLHDGSTAQSIATGATYTKLTTYVDNGFSRNCTPNVVNNKIIITKTGYYQVNGCFSFSSGTANVIYKIAPFLAGVEQDHVHLERKISSSGDVGAASFTGIIKVESVNADLDVRARHSYGSDINLTMTYSNFNISFLGDI